MTGTELVRRTHTMKFDKAPTVGQLELMLRACPDKNAEVRAFTIGCDFSLRIKGVECVYEKETPINA